MHWNYKDGVKSLSASKERNPAGQNFSRHIVNPHFISERPSLVSPQLIRDNSASLISKSPLKKSNISTFKLDTLSKNIYKLKFVYNKIKEDQYKIQTEFWQFMNQLNQIEIARTRMTLSADRNKNITPEKETKLRHEIESLKKFYEKICDEKDKKYNEMKRAYDLKGEELQEAYHTIEIKRSEIKSHEKFIHNLEKNSEENIKKLKREIEKLEMEKSSIENHYVTQINFLKTSKEETKLSLMQRLQNQKDLTKLKGSIPRSYSRDKLMGGSLKFDFKNLQEDKEFYENECEIQRKMIESLKKEKEEIIQLTIQSQDEIKRLEIENGGLQNQIESLSNQNKSLQAQLDGTKELNNSKNSEVEYINEYIDKKLTKAQVTPLKLGKIYESSKFNKQGFKPLDLSKSKRDSNEGIQSVPTSYRDFSSVDKKGSFSDSKITTARSALSTKDRDFQARLHNLEKSRTQELNNKIAILEEQNQNLYFKSSLKDREIADLKREIGLVKDKVRRQTTNGNLTSRNTEPTDRTDEEIYILKREITRLKEEALMLQSNVTQKKYSASQDHNYLILEPHEEVSFFHQTESSFEKVSKDKHDLQIKELEYKLKFSEEERARLENALLSKIDEREPLRADSYSKEELLKLIQVKSETIQQLRRSFPVYIKKIFDEMTAFYSGKLRRIHDSLNIDSQKILLAVNFTLKIHEKLKGIHKVNKNPPLTIEGIVKQLGKRFEESQQKIQEISEINHSLKVELEYIESPKRNIDDTNESQQESSKSNIESSQLDEGKEELIQELEIRVRTLEMEVTREHAENEDLKSKFEQQKSEFDRILKSLLEENAILKSKKDQFPSEEKNYLSEKTKLRERGTSEIYVQEIKTLREILSNKDDIILALQASERYLEEKVVDQEARINDLEAVMKNRHNGTNI